MMNPATEEDWLNDDKFDFDLNVSSFSLGSVDNEDVFTIEPTRNEAKSAVAFGIKNPVTAGIAPLRGNNAHSRSPVAVVHPMKREMPVSSARKENKENILDDSESTSKDDVLTTLQNTGFNSNGLTYRESQSSAVTKLLGKSKQSSQPKTQPKIDNIEDELPGLVEPFNEIKSNLNDQEGTQKYNIDEKPKGLNKKTITRACTPDNPAKFGKPLSRQTPKAKIPPSNVAGTKSNVAKDENSAVGLSKVIGAQDLQKRLKKPLMIPKPSSISKAKSGGNIPSSLPSSLPNRSKSISGLKPLKPTSQSLSGIAIAGENQSTKFVSGVAQSQLKLPGRKCVSSGTPTDLKKATVGSAKRKSLGRKAHATSVNMNSEKKLQKPPNSETKKTPLAKSRRSIVGRKLNHDNDESNEPASIDACPNTNKKGDNRIEAECSELKEGSKMKFNEDESARNESPVCNMLIPDSGKIITDHNNPNTSCISNVDTSQDFVDNILKDNEVTTKETDISLKPCAASTDDIIRSTENEPQIESHDLLIDFEFTDPERNKISPIRFNNLDPFETGNTPPPLIQLDIVLEPEKPPEVNLIEF